MSTGIARQNCLQPTGFKELLAHPTLKTSVFILFVFLNLPRISILIRVADYLRPAIYDPRIFVIFKSTLYFFEFLFANAFPARQFLKFTIKCKCHCTREATNGQLLARILSLFSWCVDLVRINVRKDT